MPRPISGRRFAPKIRMMMNRMTSSSGIPRWGSMMAPSGAIRSDLTTESRAGRPKPPRWVLALALLFGSAGGVGAQFASSVNVVEVYATVSDARGNPVTGLSKEDFLVRENGEEIGRASCRERV